MDAFPTPEADSFAERAKAINARHAAAVAKYRRQSAAAIHVMLCGLFILGIWAINEAEQHYKREALVNQESTIAWNR
ncbi:hypothetical protein [Agrobacterium rosae]|uniref:hypothetical protein n=1 Tax=Agrobacterium rosae TaxID=1972867 RepID=UPI002A1586EB|nr:hypothetical protein [Agrobacterium rosae]